MRALALLPAALLTACGAADDFDPDCEVDTDNDSVPDCDDPDDDGDGLEDAEEADLGTDPLRIDSDADGLTDDEEVGSSWEYSPDGDTSSGTISSDPTIPTLLVEVDFMMGVRPDPDVFVRATRSFETAGIEAFFKIDDGSPIAPVSPLIDAAELEAVAMQSRDRTAYAHVVFAEYGEGTKHGTTHYGSPNDPTLGHGNEPDPSVSAAFVFAQQIADDFATYSVAFGGVGITEPALAARTFVHEIGHLIGMTHEGPDGGYDPTNVMISNSDVGNPDADPDRWREATLSGDLGHPTFSDAAREQLDLSRKASVETAATMIAWDFDMGTPSSPVNPDTFRVTTEMVFDDARGYGWLEPAPTEAAESGSSADDARTADYIVGEPGVVADTIFAVRGLGRGPLRVFLRLGATLDAPRDVRCELVHPEFGTAHLQGTIDAGGASVQTSGDGVVVFPVTDPTSLGYGPGAVELVCLDGEGREDAPIEYMRITKREP